MKRFFLLFGLAVLAGGQDLDNNSVLKMVKAGLEERLLINLIQSQPGRFSLSGDEIVKLKQQGVSDGVLAAMIVKSSGGTTAGATSSLGGAVSGDANDPLVPHDSGVYLYTKDRDGKPQMIVLERAAYQGAKTGGTLGAALTYGIKKARTKAIIPGTRASIRSVETNPEFYFYFDDKAAGLGKSYFGTANVSNPNQFALLKLDVSKSTREIVIMEINAYGSSSGTNEKSMIGFKSERIRSGLYRVTMNTPLQSGEYCFLASATALGAYGAGAAGAADIFDFGVSAH